MNFSKIEKVNNLLGNSENKNEKKVDQLLGRSTFIKQPQSLIETQFIDLQKSKKYKSEIIFDDKTQKNNRRCDFNPSKNNSLMMYSTHKSLKKSCIRVNPKNLENKCIF